MKKRRGRKTWQKSQRDVMKSLGATETPASGAFEGHKADGDHDLGFKIEHKSTEKSGFRITNELLTKITIEAAQAGKLPAFSIDLVNSGHPPWIMVPLNVFQELLEAQETKLR